MRPEHTYPPKQEEYDVNVFRGAAYFTVVIPGRGKWENIPTFSEALQRVGESRRAMIYAVTASGRATMLVRKRWDEFLQMSKG